MSETIIIAVISAVTGGGLAAADMNHSKTN